MLDTKTRKHLGERRTGSMARIACVTAAALVTVKMSASLNAQKGDPQAELQQRLAG